MTSVMRSTRAALRYFRDAGHGGVIVNNASVIGWRAQAEHGGFYQAQAAGLSKQRVDEVLGLDVPGPGVPGEARERTASGTRKFARKQLGWFRRDPRIEWLPALDEGLAQRVVAGLQ